MNKDLDKERAELSAGVSMFDGELLRCGRRTCLLPAYEKETRGQRGVNDRPQVIQNGSKQRDINAKPQKRSCISEGLSE